MDLVHSNKYIAFSFHIFAVRRIIRLIPKRLTKWQDIIDVNVEEIKSEYIFVSKKSVVDFVLGKSLDDTGKHDVKASHERLEIKDIGKHYAQS